MVTAGLERLNGRDIGSTVVISAFASSFERLLESLPEYVRTERICHIEGVQQLSIVASSFRRESSQTPHPE